MSKTKTDEINQESVVYTKEQILGSKKYKHRRDALGVILTDDENYTIDKVDSLLENFMKGKVK